MNPTVLIGVGVPAAAIVREALRYSAVFGAGAPPVARAITLLCDGDPAPAGDAVELRCSIHGAGETANAWIADGVRPVMADLMATAAGAPDGSGVSGACQVIVVVLAADPCGAAFGVPAATAARQAASAVLAGMRVTVHLYAVLPPGAVDAPGPVMRILHAIEAENQSGSSVISRVHLVAGASVDGPVYSEPDMHRMVAAAVALRMSDGIGDFLTRRDAELAAAPGAIGSFGLSSLELDTHELAEVDGLSYARTLVRCGLLAPEPVSDQAKALCAELVHALSLDGADLSPVRRHLATVQVGSERRSILDGLRMPPFVLSDVPARRWHVALANFAVFIKRERLGPALERVQENARLLLAQHRQAVCDAVDKMISASRDPQNAEYLLDYIHDNVQRCRASLVDTRGKEPAAAPAADTRKLLRELGIAAASEPRMVGLCFRAATAAAPLALALALLARLVVGLPTTGAMSLPVWLGASLLSLTAGMAWAWNVARRARDATLAAARRCEDAIYDECRSRAASALDRAVDETVTALLLITARPDRIGEIAKDYSGPNEFAEVIRFREMLQESVLPSIRQGVESDRPAWAVSALGYVGERARYPYAEQPGFSDWSGEVRALLAGGLFSDWRTVTPQELAGRIEEHTLARMSYVKRITLDGFMREALAGRPDLGETYLRIHNDLRSRSAPALSLCIPSDQPDVAVLAAHEPRDASATGWIIRNSHPMVASLVSPNHCLLLRLLDAVDTRVLAGRQLWDPPHDAGASGPAGSQP